MSGPGDSFIAAVSIGLLVILAFALLILSARITYAIRSKSAPGSSRPRKQPPYPATEEVAEPDE